MEERLSFCGLPCAIGELVRLSNTASRRLQLAAEKTGSMTIVLRRWRRQNEASDYGQPKLASLLSA
jgi:protein ImuA